MKHQTSARKRDGCPTFAQAYSGFPVELPGAGDLHAAFLNESRTRRCWWRLVQEIRIRGPKTMGAALQLLLSNLQPSSSRVGTPVRLAQNIWRIMPIRWKIPALGLLVLCAITKGDVIAQSTPVPTMTLLVDETQAFRRIGFVHEEIRVQPGPLALAYPRWIPGEHGPTGPIQNLAAIRVHSGEVTLPWTRDPDDINTIKIDVPPNTSKVTVDFDTLLENTISDHQILLAWNTSVLYPRGIDKRELMIE